MQAWIRKLFPRPTTTVRRAETKLGVESLELREVPSVTSVFPSGSTVYVFTDNNATQVTINPSGSCIRVVEGGTGRYWEYAASSVSQVTVCGGAGNDRFINNVNTLPVCFSGNGGDDYLMGYGAAESLCGGDGNDTLLGYGGDDILSGGAGRDNIKGMTGNDTIYGDAGDDVLVGGDGDDWVYGDDGNDQVIGGAGNDHLYGGYGDDTLVTIDGGTTDYADGQSGRDTVWRDENGFWPFYTHDTANAEKVYDVSGFANGADRSLDGDNIADPTDSTNCRNFRNNPLFADGGPTINDVDQNGLGDCWMMGALGAAVNDNAYVGREMVADFGDGTYGVHLGNSFYRVDADLPTDGYGSLIYAGLGVQNSLWVPLVEKAYASYRNGSNTFASLNGGDPMDANQAFGLTDLGGAHYAQWSNPATVANTLYDHWQWVNHSATICTGTVPYGSPLVGNHCYSVTWMDRDASGNVTRIYLRNPWGPNNTGGNPYLSITPAQMAACEIWLRWGTSA